MLEVEDGGEGRTHADAVAEAKASAKHAGLVYVTDTGPGITRELRGDQFVFFDPKGKEITDEAEVARIRKLAIPPAYQDVWICPRANGHIQATGRDAKGRKQYRYHPKWSEERDSHKYEHVMLFGRLLPKIRDRIAADMRQHGLGRDKVLATVVDLLQSTLIRVGNEDYVRENKSYGLTTLRTKHVDIQGNALRFSFKGKSGKTWNLQLKDKRIAKVVKACQDLPGQHLFQYVDDKGERHDVTSADVNAYLHEITGEDITAKDFRTWAGTVLASMALSEFEKVDTAAAMKKNVKAAIEHVSSRLGNTPTICRKCYVHPEVLNSYMDGKLVGELKHEVEEELEDVADLKPEEAALLGLLNRRLGLDLKKKRAAA
jgi:DNA topoisomerase I